MKIMRIFSTAVAFVAAASLTALAGVTVHSPADDSDVTSPFTLSATAFICASRNVVSMGYSFDTSSDTTVVYAQSIDRAISGPTGTHTLHVKAWGGHGTSCVTDVTVTIRSGGGGSGSEPVVPPNAVTVHNIEILSDWKESHDTAGIGSSSGYTKLVSSPSHSGNSRQFVTDFSNSGDERYSVVFADDTQAKNFVYDGWILFTDSSKYIANLELDMNQVMANGQTLLTGVQCDGYTGLWDYTVNEGSAQNPRPHWVGKTGTNCNPRDWSTNTWHHVQASLSRDDSGYITYHSVWLDGVESKLDATVYGAADLGWGNVINTQFQIDGLGSGGKSTAYLNDLSISRW